MTKKQVEKISPESQITELSVLLLPSSRMIPFCREGTSGREWKGLLALKISAQMFLCLFESGSDRLIFSIFQTQVMGYTSIEDTNLAGGTKTAVSAKREGQP
jgi:hypothetical protein